MKTFALVLSLALALSVDALRVPLVGRFMRKGGKVCAGYLAMTESLTLPPSCQISMGDRTFSADEVRTLHSFIPPPVCACLTFGDI